MHIETAYTSLLGLGLEIAAVSLFFVYLCQCRGPVTCLCPSPSVCPRIWYVRIVMSSKSWFKKIVDKQ